MIYTSSEAVELTKRWLELMVIGHDLCPFAKWPYEHDLVKIITANPAEDLMQIINAELQFLHDNPSPLIETTLIVSPDDAISMLDWLDQQMNIQDWIDGSIYESDYQAVMFHPDFQYRGEHPESTVNITNRSPLPMIHLLREATVTKVIEDGADTAQIIAKNSKTLEQMGWDGWGEVLKTIHQ